MDAAGYEKTGNRKIRGPQFDMLLKKASVQGAIEMKNHGQVFGRFFVDRHSGAQGQAVGGDFEFPSENRVAKSYRNLLAGGGHFRWHIRLVTHEDHPAPSGQSVVIFRKSIGAHVPVEDEYPQIGVQVEHRRAFFMALWQQMREQFGLSGVLDPTH
jgi:hypothetical protein